MIAEANTAKEAAYSLILVLLRFPGGNPSVEYDIASMQFDDVVIGRRLQAVDLEMPTPTRLQRLFYLKKTWFHPTFICEVAPTQAMGGYLLRIRFHSNR